MLLHSMQSAHARRVANVNLREFLRVDSQLEDALLAAFWMTAVGHEVPVLAFFVEKRKRDVLSLAGVLQNMAGTKRRQRAKPATFLFQSFHTFDLFSAAFLCRMRCCCRKAGRR